MLARLKRSWSSRPARKFRRNRLAVASLIVIAIYALIGLWVVSVDLTKSLGASAGRWTEQEFAQRHPILNLLTAQSALGVVGPDERPGLGLPPRAEERVRSIKRVLDDLNQAFRVRARGGEDRDTRIRAVLASIKLGDRPLIDRPAAELRAEVDALRTLYGELASVEDLDRSPEARPKVDELDARTRALFVAPTGAKRITESISLSLGTDRQGRSIALKALYSIKVAIQIGLVVAIISTLLGSLLGAAAAFYGGWMDHAIVWLYSTLSSLPDLVLLGVLVFMFTGSIFDDVTRPWLSLVPIYVAMCLTFWIGPCRVVRGEVMKIKELEYIQAATAIGFGRFYILLRHALPNTIHLMLINFSLLFIAAIKNEVVLSFLGLGVKTGTSWGMMIQESTQQVINGFYWQIAAATAFMFLLVLAFNIVSDALQDAFDPKHVG